MALDSLDGIENHNTSRTVFRESREREGRLRAALISYRKRFVQQYLLHDVVRKWQHASIATRVNHLESYILLVQPQIELPLRGTTLTYPPPPPSSP